MAISTAMGYTQFPNGYWSPEIWSNKVQKAFRQKAVARAITNGEYMGEIGSKGDTVRIIKEPAITIRDYARGGQTVTQELVDEEFQLTVDQAKYWQFSIDDIEDYFTHIDWENMATNRAGYELANNQDQDLLGYMTGYKQSANQAVADTARSSSDIPGTKAISTAGDDELLTSMKLRKDSFSKITTASAGDHSIPVANKPKGATTTPTEYVTPLNVLSRMQRQLDLQNVDRDGRCLVIDPYFKEMLLDEDSPVVHRDFGAAGSELKNGLLWPDLYGFMVYESQNLPAIGGGPGTSGTANQNTDYGVLLATHKSSVAFVENILKTGSFDSHDTFGKVVRGLQVFGRKILRPEGIVTAKYNVA